MAAAGTELCIGHQVFAAVGALGKNELLVPAQGAEFGLRRNAAAAIMTGGGRFGGRSLSAVEIISGLDEGDRVIISSIDQFRGADTVLITD